MATVKSSYSNPGLSDEDGFKAVNAGSTWKATCEGLAATRSLQSLWLKVERMSAVLVTNMQKLHTCRHHSCVRVALIGPGHSSPDPWQQTEVAHSIAEGHPTWLCSVAKKICGRAEGLQGPYSILVRTGNTTELLAEIALI